MRPASLWLTGLVALSALLAVIANSIATDYFAAHWDTLMFADNHR